VFVAYPALLGDTLAFSPHLLADLQSSAPRTISPTQSQALQRNQDLLLRFAREWVQTSRDNPDAWEALATARELRGELDGGDDGARAALENARKLSRSPAQQTRLAAAQVRIDVKEGAFRDAREAVDSIFEANGLLGLDPESADVLTGLAALTGRIAQSATLQTSARSTQYSNIGIAPALGAAAAKFFARAAPGVCDDSLRAMRREFERVLESYSAPERRARHRQVVLWQAAALAFPCMGQEALGELAPTSALDRSQRAFLGRNPQLLAAIRDSVLATRGGYRPGDISLDFTVQEAWLRAASGDTTAAERQLDLVLEALPTLNTRSAVMELAQSAAIGRAMVFRADLAAARKDAAAAKRWAANVVELWANADASLQPTVDRMRRISR
jgi:hypothetical protein